MKMERILSAVGLIALGALLMGARGNLTAPTFESRPQLIQEGVVVITVDRQNGTPNPLKYKILKVDGPWLNVQLLKKNARSKRGDPFWLNVRDIGAFIAE